MIDSISNQLLVIIANNRYFVLKCDLPIAISIWFALSNYWYSAILLTIFLYYLTILLVLIEAFNYISWIPLLKFSYPGLIIIHFIIAILPYPKITQLPLIIISLLLITLTIPILLINFHLSFILSIFHHKFIWNLRIIQCNLYHFDTQST